MKSLFIPDMLWMAVDDDIIWSVISNGSSRLIHCDVLRADGVFKCSWWQRVVHG